MRLFGVDLVYNHADFRLTDRRAPGALAEYGEVNLFLQIHGCLYPLAYKGTGYHKGKTFLLLT